MAAALTIPDALDELNKKWFTSLKPRWVDIIGSYAGKELFLVDGDALIQTVLDDPLLELGRKDSCDWQILHAYYSVESILDNLRKRGAEFHVVFFESNRPLAIGTSENAWIASSRSLAHKTLKAYIHSLEVEVHEFTDTRDKRWKEYVFFNKPLFILSSDHSVALPESDDSLPAANLLHRVFIKYMHDEGLLLASLQEMDFRDSQANTFLYDRQPQANLSREFYKAVGEAREALDELMPVDVDDDEEEEVDKADDVQSWPEAAIKHYLSELTSSPTPPQLALLFTFLAHVKLLDTIDLDLRSQPQSTLPSGLVKLITEGFLPGLFASLEATIPGDVDEPPLVDGRIFSLLLANILFSDTQPSQVLGGGVYASLIEKWKELGLQPVDFGVLAQLAQKSGGNRQLNEQKVFQEFSLYSFEAPVLQEILSEVEVPTVPSDEFGGVPEPLYEFEDSIFARTRRHHTYRSPIPRHLGGEPPKPKDKKGMMKLLRSNQRSMVHIERQANSLTGAKGAKLEAEVIPPVGNVVGSQWATGSALKNASRPDTPEVKGTKGRKGQPAAAASSTQPSPPSQAAKGKGGKGKKEPPMKSADKLRMQIESQKKAKALTDGEAWWKSRLEELKNIEELSGRIEMLDLQLKSNKRMEADPTLAANVWLYRINCECWHWIENPDGEKPKVKDGYIIRLVKMVRGMKQYQDVLTPTMVKCLWSVMEALGFDDYVQVIQRPSKDVKDKKLDYDFIKFYKKILTGPEAGTEVNAYPWMAITEHPVDWQLRAFGEHMDRSFDSKPDDRVKFEPDKWQRDVLDKLDRDESVLVVAPTSAGKTFISYYAMKKVLTTSDDGILVYVAPTKALVTQITAEVYARYRKDMKGRSCWAIHTADIRLNNPQTCQILVTVPEMLAFMLLSPELAKVWAPRIKRIILDEIHTLGSQPGGVWEQILLLSRCPIIGLSATVGDADAFNEWLKSVQEAHGHTHSLVQHHHRYSHLRKFMYNIDPEPEDFDGLHDHKATQQMRFLHPISFIRPGITELPSDLALEARDCATLYKAMSDHSDDPALAKLKPTKFFEKHNKAGEFLQQADVIKYEEKLKAVLTKWLKEDDAHEPTSTIQKVVKSLTDKEVGKPEYERALQNSDMFYGNLVNLLADLHSEGDLPALLFHFDRYSVEAIARAILEKLKKDETEWRKHSPEWEKKIKGWQAWEAGAKEREKAAQRAALKKEKAEGDKMERLQNAAAVDTSPLAIYANFDPDAPSEEFSFINWGTRYSASELDEDIKNLERYSTTPRFLLECLRRGIAVHHSGLPKGYRVLVESLFRIGFCRVVVSTEELALGVNMPAKASIFCGDSPALTALMYRQCAGRAGRRGFDLLGKVIFYGLPNERVKQVVLSRLPALRGNYPLTPTLSLRLISLLTDSGNAPSATNAIQDLLKLDSLTVGSNISRSQSLYNMRFSIELLIRAQVIDSAGNPLHPWFNFASFLYTNEPANLALLALLREGYIHKICNNNLIDAKRDLMHILSYLFCRQYLSKVNFDQEAFARNNRTPSKVILSDIDQEAYKILKGYNDEVLQVFTECAVMYSIQHRDSLGVDNILPFSERTVEATSTPSSSTFVQSLKRSRVTVRSRSAFVATSGHGDVYSDVDELSRTTRHGLHLTKHVLPSLDLLTPSSDSPGRYLNAYLFDFYSHGQDKPLVDANRIEKSQIWYLLLDFSQALDGMVTAIKDLMLKGARGEDDLTSVAGESVAVAAATNTVQDDWAADLEKDEAIAPSGPQASHGVPLEKERGDEAEALGVGAGSGEIDIVKPDHVSMKDWKVYEVFWHLQKDFNEKFKAMWA